MHHLPLDKKLCIFLIAAWGFKCFVQDADTKKNIPRAVTHAAIFPRFSPKSTNWQRFPRVGGYRLLQGYWCNPRLGILSGVEGFLWAFSIYSMVFYPRFLWARRGDLGSVAWWRDLWPSEFRQCNNICLAMYISVRLLFLVFFYLFVLTLQFSKFIVLFSSFLFLSVFSVSLSLLFSSVYIHIYAASKTIQISFISCYVAFLFSATGVHTIPSRFGLASQKWRDQPCQLPLWHTKYSYLSYLRWIASYISVRLQIRPSLLNLL